METFGIGLVLDLTEENRDAGVTGGHGVQEALSEHQDDQRGEQNDGELRVHVDSFDDRTGPADRVGLYQIRS